MTATSSAPFTSTIIDDPLRGLLDVLSTVSGVSGFRLRVERRIGGVFGVDVDAKGDGVDDDGTAVGFGATGKMAELRRL